VAHGRLPRSPNGKVDRSSAALLAVPEPVQAGFDTAVDAELEQKMSALFARTLGRAEHDPATSFFDVGGHSLLAVDLVMGIEETLGMKVAVSTLYQAPSPRALAATLTEPDPALAATGGRDELTGRGRSTPDAALTDGLLIPIQPNGDRPPIFAIHVLGINCAYFRPLSAELGDRQPLYGLGQPTTEPDPDAVSSDVSEIAATYVRHINRTAPEGPVVLAAISLGGVVAYETAQQLTAAGRHVELLVLFDCFGPHAEQDRTVGDKLRYHAESPPSPLGRTGRDEGPGPLVAAVQSPN